jgi:DNA-binding NtrC family response regulator
LPKPDSGRSAHILLLDHDESVLEAVSTFLRARDHHVHAARNMEEARAVLAHREVDLIVADFQLAGSSNGRGLEGWLARHKPVLSRRLIWMCAVAPVGAAAERIAQSNSRVLEKPFKVSELLAAVDDLLLNRVDAAPIGR